MSSDTKEAVVNPSHDTEPHASKAEKAKPGASWKAGEEQVSPENGLTLVYFRTLCYYSELLTIIIGGLWLDALRLPRSPRSGIYTNQKNSWLNLLKAKYP